MHPDGPGPADALEAWVRPVPGGWQLVVAHRRGWTLRHHPAHADAPMTTEQALARLRELTRRPPVVALTARSLTVRRLDPDGAPIGPPLELPDAYVELTLDGGSRVTPSPSDLTPRSPHP